jgi:transporter family protein
MATAFSWICYFRALELGLASKVAPIDKLSVIFAIAMAAIFLHEPVSWQQWSGGAMIMGGAVLLSLF